jgi:anaerobic selenocysteine-containing dehydrogenase
MEQRQSACPLDCPDLCGLTVTVEGGRVTAVDGDRRGPLTDGFICGKVRKIADHLYGDDRVLAPLVRTGPKGSGQFRTASWDEALDLVAGRLASIRATSGGEYQGDLPINLHHSAKFRPGISPFHEGMCALGKSRYKLILRRIYEISKKRRILTC